MLSTQLKELDQSGLIVRKEYTQIPPKVEYHLSSKGIELRPVFEQMCDWIFKLLPFHKTQIIIHMLNNSNCKR